MQQIALVVRGMDSRDCERVVTTALINEPGVFWATADAGSDLASACYDPERTDVEALGEAVESSGYTPKPPRIE